MENISSVSHTDGEKQKFFTFDRWIGLIGWAAFIFMIVMHVKQEKFLFGNGILVLAICGVIAIIRLKVITAEDPLFIRIMVIFTKIILLIIFCGAVAALFNALYL